MNRWACSLMDTLALTAYYYVVYPWRKKIYVLTSSPRRLSVTPSSSTLTPIACLIGMTPSSFHPSEGLAKVCLVMCPSNGGTLVPLPLSYLMIEFRLETTHGQQTASYVYSFPRRRFDSQHISLLWTCSPGRRRVLRSRYFNGRRVGPRTLVVQTRSRLPKMAVHHTWVVIPPASLFPLQIEYHTPVADMLAHSPPLPLVIDHKGVIGFEPSRTVEDEEGILLALQHRNRLRRIRIVWPLLSLQKFIMAMDGEFPILEYLHVAPSVKSNTSLVLPHTFQASHLRHLILTGFAFPTKRPLFPTTAGVVTLSLQEIHSDANFRLNDLFHLLSLSPQLESLAIGFHFPFPNRDVRRQLSKMSNMMHLTLPNLRHFAFEGNSTYLDGNASPSNHRPSPREAPDLLLQPVDLFRSVSPGPYEQSREPSFFTLRHSISMSGASRFHCTTVR